MYSPLSLEWEKALRSGGVRRTRVDLYAGPTEPVAAVEDLNVSEWSVTADRRSSVRRTASLTLRDRDLLAAMKDPTQGSYLRPYGSEFHISTGIIQPDGTEELVPLGIFHLEKLTWDQDETSMTLDLVDRSRFLERSIFASPFYIGGEPVVDTIKLLMLHTSPWMQLQYRPEEATYTLPGGAKLDSNVLDSCQDLASALGLEFFVDVTGVAQLRPVPFVSAATVDNQAVWRVNAGDYGVLISTNRSISRVDTFNQIHVYGAAPNGTTQQPFYTAYDLDPESITYIYGPFGVSNKKIERQDLLTVAQCQVVAEAELNNSRGLSKTLSLTSVSNPALSEGDIILVEYQDGTRELHLVDQITFDHTGASSIDTRVQVGVA